MHVHSATSILYSFILVIQTVEQKTSTRARNFISFVQFLLHIKAWEVHYCWLCAVCINISYNAL